MDPVMTAAVVTAVIGAVGTVLAAWVQGRAQRSAKPADRVRPAEQPPSRCRDERFARPWMCAAEVTDEFSSLRPGLPDHRPHGLSSPLKRPCAGPTDETAALPRPPATDRMPFSKRIGLSIEEAPGPGRDPRASAQLRLY
jgi:hypothetical protein